MALPGGPEYFPGKDEGNRDESVEDPDFPGKYLPSVGQLYDILRNLGKADMMIFLDSYVEKIPEAERDLFSESTGAVWSSSHSWTYFSNGGISYAARLVSFYAGISTISYSTFGVADVRLVFAFR